jgi:hypothetical protein
MSYSSCLFNGRRIKFILVLGVYQNIITFLEANEISFFSTMELDFTKIPLVLHGKGISKNLLEYLSNNSSNGTLISKFLNYFIDIINIKYSNNENLKFKFSENSEWQNIKLEIMPPYTNINQWPNGVMYNDTILYDYKIWYN